MSCGDLSRPFFVNTGRKKDDGILGQVCLFDFSHDLSAAHHDDAMAQTDQLLHLRRDHDLSDLVVIADWDAYWAQQLADDFWRRSHRMRLPTSP